MKNYRTDEYRAKHRAEYAKKHANDPMTEHRQRCIKAANERMQIPLNQRKINKYIQETQKEAEIELCYLQSEKEHERKRQTIIKYIQKWTKRNVFATRVIHGVEIMKEADIRAYYQESIKYFELQDKLEKLSKNDYTSRNIISYKMRCIEDRFNELLNKHYATNKKIKTE